MDVFSPNLITFLRNINNFYTMSKLPKTASTRSKAKRVFSYTPDVSLPKLGEYKTEWDLAGLYYKNENDPRIEADVLHTIALYTKFAKKWRNKDFTSNAKVLKTALSEYIAVSTDSRSLKPGLYFSFRSCLNVSDSVADKALAILHKRLRPVSDQTLFFVLELGKIPTKQQKVYLNDPELAEYRYFLSRIFITAKHHLTEAEEKIISLKSRQSSAMWHELTEKLIGEAEIKWKGKSVPLSEALEMISVVTSSEKPKLWKLITSKLETFGTVAEFEFNALISDVRNEDDLRTYKKPYSATALSYQHDEKTIEAVVEAVSIKGFEQSKKFYKLKAEIKGVDKIHYSQKYDSIGESAKVSFDQALTVCRDVFYKVNPRYGEVFDQMVTSGQIDVYPKKGKRGGAFMSYSTGQPIQVMLNHTDTMNSLRTLAHEMGHAIHADRSATQAPLYDSHTIVTAETASTLFENLVFDAMYTVATDEEKVVLLHDRISESISTIQRQIAFFNCELEIHNTIHEKGAMTHTELKSVMQKHLASYLGPAVDVQLEDGVSYIYVGHLRYGFYVYSYSFGLLMSTIMAKKFKENNDYREQIETFLCAGQSDTVINIFKKIGISTDKADTFTEALKNQEAYINEFKKLLKKTKLGK